MKQPHFGGISLLMRFSGLRGLLALVFFSGPRKWAKIAIFLILPDPGCPRDPKVESHTDPVVSWDTVGGIRALVCPQGPPQAGFGVAKKRCARRRARLVGQIWLGNGENLDFGKSWILPDPGCPRDPTIGSHSDCVVSWDTLEGLQALFCVQGPLKNSFGVPVRRSCGSWAGVVG